MKHYKTIQINGKQVRLHRYLMEKKLGRKLTFNEIVHHINGNKFDNRIENLEVISRCDHMKKHPEIAEAYIDKIKIKFNRNDIKYLYKEKSIEKIAKLFSVAPMTIWKYMKENNIKTNKRGYKYE